jgi:MFS family permease
MTYQPDAKLHLATMTAAQEWRRFWSLPLAAALGEAISVLHVYSLGPFIGPLQQEFGWSRAQISLGITIASFGTAIFCIPIGILVDRVGPRRVGLPGVILLCGAFALLGTATGTMVNWLLLWGLVFLGILFSQATVWTSAVASRFERSRGLALAVTLCGASLGAAGFPILATWVIADYGGWRAAFFALGGFCAAVALPVLFLFFRGAQDTDRQQRAASKAAARELPGISFAEGVRSPALYKLVLASSLFSFSVVGLIVHFVPILTDRGTSPMAAAGIASLIGISSIFGRLGTGALLDRFPGHLVGSVAFLMAVCASVLLLLDGTNATSQVVAAIILGLNMGAEVDVIAYLAARHFGVKNFGSLFGTLMMALAVGTAFGPLAAGATFDNAATYEPFLLLTAVLMGIGAISLFSVGPAPAHVAPVQAT